MKKKNRQPGVGTEPAGTLRANIGSQATVPCLLRNYGLIGMSESLEIMRRHHARILNGGPECVMFFTSRPAICAGKGFADRHLRVSMNRIAERGVEFHHVDRGGSVTVHGPGQLVAYVLLRLDRYGRDIHDFLRRLEQSGIETANFFGVKSYRIQGRTGVWTDDGKLMAIGIGAKKWITMHGLCLNLEPEHSLFDMVIPCGLDDRRQAGLCALAGRHIPYSQAVSVMAGALSRVFELEFVNQESIMKKKLPPWFKKRIRIDGSADMVQNILDRHRMATVCTHAHCPNHHECYSNGTAVFMILGTRCTRNCRFCAVEKGRPMAVDETEPVRLASAAAEMGLSYVVITSVTRDDLADGGAAQFASCVKQVRRTCPKAKIEVLIPDYTDFSLDIVMASGPDVLNHNLETVPRLYSKVRPMARYEKSLKTLAQAAAYRISTVKSGIMVGLGETQDEIDLLMSDCVQNGCKILTIGQYLQPHDGCMDVVQYMEQDVFDRYRKTGESMGLTVFAGPFVRSSYHAQEVFNGCCTAGEKQ